MSLRNQLIGTWKSHRKRTLDHFAPYHKQKDVGKKRTISGMFGKLELKWTKKYVYYSFEGFGKATREKVKYEIVDESEDTLIVKIEETLGDELSIFDGITYLVIQFEETRYHKYYSAYTSRWNYVEWFQKVSD
jgi:hypothetical protein